MPPDFVLALLVAPTFAQDPVDLAPVDDPVGETFSVVFAEALDMPTDRLLEGMDATTDLAFPLPSAWDLIEDPVVTLSFDHSSALLAERSHLTLTLNGQPLGTASLDSSSGLDGSIRARIPRDALQPWNHLQVHAIQHVARSCEDPFDPSLWTRIRRDSRVDFRFRRRPVDPDLSAFPAPFLDETAYTPSELTLVLPEHPSAATVDAAGRVALALGRMTDYRGIRLAPPVRDVRVARTHAIVLGIATENPEVHALLGDIALDPGQGMMATVPNPADPTLAVLIVTGADAEGLGRASRAISGRNRQELLDGTRARVDAVVDEGPPPSRRVPGPAPARTHYTLADLDLDDRTVRGFYTEPIRVPLGLEGDAAVRPGGAHATIEYAYGTSLDPRLSAMEVRVDGVTVKSVALDDPEGTSLASTTFEIPDTLLRPDSRLEVAFHLFPRDFDACHYVTDRPLWATVYASSSLDIARDHVADMPDLGRLQFGAWPFTLEPHGGAVIAALPDLPTARDVTAGFLLATELGRVSTAEHPSFRLAPASDVPFSKHPYTSFIVLSTTAPNALHEALAKGGLAVVPGPGGRQLLDETRTLLLGATIDTSGGVMEELAQPENPDRAVLLLHAPDGSQLIELVALVTDTDAVGRLTGNVAVVTGQGSLKTLAVATRRQVGSYAVGASIQRAMRRHWVLLGAGLLAGAFLFTAVKRAWAARRNGE